MARAVAIRWVEDGTVKRKRWKSEENATNDLANAISHGGIESPSDARHVGVSVLLIEYLPLNVY